LRDARIAQGVDGEWQHHPHPTLLDSAIQASPSNPALRILLRAFCGARASGSQARRFTP
jgi:hypothetical protein